jgi:hypothetical protein
MYDIKIAANKVKIQVAKRPWGFERKAWDLIG